MRAHDLARLVVACHLHRHAITAPRDAHALRFEPDGGPFVLEDRPDSDRDFLVFPADESRRHLDNGHAAAEPPVHLRELQSDIAASDDDQMLGQEIDVHHAAVGKEGDFGEAGHVWHARPAANVDEDLVALEKLSIDAHAAWSLEA